MSFALILNQPQDGLSGAELGRRLLIDSATVTGIADRLQSAGLLERRPHGEDRRVHSLFLTEPGQALQASLDAAMDQLNDDVAREMGEEAPALWTSLRRFGEAKV